VPRLTRERIKHHADESACDHCGAPIYVGDFATYADATGGVYCGRACAQEGEADRGGHGPFTSADGSAQAARN
jgi:hypothetical protein